MFPTPGCILSNRLNTPDRLRRSPSESVVVVPVCWSRKAHSFRLRVQRMIRDRQRNQHITVHRYQVLTQLLSSPRPNDLKSLLPEPWRPVLIFLVDHHLKRETILDCDGQNVNFETPFFLYVLIRSLVHHRGLGS